MCSNLESLQDAEFQELLRRTQKLEALRILKEMKIQLQDKNQELQRENKMLEEENEKIWKENKKLQKENENLQKECEELQKENERLHDMLCQLNVTASQSQQHTVSLGTQMPQGARLTTSQEMTQTSSSRKVKGSPKDPKAVIMDKDSSKKDPSVPAFSSKDLRSLKEGPVRKRCSPD